MPREEPTFTDKEKQDIHDALTILIDRDQVDELFVSRVRYRGGDALVLSTGVEQSEEGEDVVYPIAILCPNIEEMSPPSDNDPTLMVKITERREEDTT